MKKQNPSRVQKRTLPAPWNIRVITLPHNSLQLEYFDYRYHKEIAKEGRARIVEAKPPRRAKKYLVIKKFEAPRRHHADWGFAGLEPIGEARLQLEIIKKLRGTPVTAAKPLAILAHPKGAKSLVSELVSGQSLPSELSSGFLTDAEGLRLRPMTAEAPLSLVHGLLSSRGIIPLDFHGKNVYFDGKKYVIVDSKHATPHPDSRASEQLFKYRRVYDEARGEAVPLKEYMEKARARLEAAEKLDTSPQKYLGGRRILIPDFHGLKYDLEKYREYVPRKLWKRYGLA